MLICINYFLRAVKDAGLPNILAVSALNDENSAAVLSHHGVRMLVVDNSSSLPAQPGNHVQKISLLQSDLSTDNVVEQFVLRKWVWTATGDGLAN